MTKKNLITIVTDHHLTADTIAQAIGATEKHAGYYLGNGYAVTWTNGSVIEAIFNPEQGFVLSSNMDPKLVYAHNFTFKMRNIDNLLGYKKSEIDKRQLSTIRILWSMSHTVVNAMAPDIDGELDFLSLYYFLATPVEVRRAWLPILTKEAIVKGIENGPTDVSLYMDWQEANIYNYLVDFCEQDAEYRHEHTTVFVEVPVDTASKEVVDLKCVGIDTPSPGSMTAVGSSIYTYTDKPTLFNLTQLLIEAAVQLDYTHEKTIQTALNLYAKKLISYPIVMQNYIPSDIWKQMFRNREVLRFNSKWGKSVKGGKLSSRHNFEECMNPFNGFGIVTTGIHPTNLSRDEEKLYNIIVKRVLDAFTPNDTIRNRKDKERSRKLNTSHETNFQTK